MKTAILLVCMLSTLSSVQLSNPMNQVNKIDVVQVEQANEMITPRADVIKRVYRIYDDVLQYRRWNETRGYWVDPDWIVI